MVYFRQGICFGVLRCRDAGMVLLCFSPGSEAWDVCMQGTRGGGGELEGDFHGTACPGAGASSRAAEGWAAARSSHGHIEGGHHLSQIRKLLLSQLPLQPARHFSLVSEFEQMHVENPFSPHWL